MWYPLTFLVVVEKLTQVTVLLLLDSIWPKSFLADDLIQVLALYTRKMDYLESLGQPHVWPLLKHEILDNLLPLLVVEVARPRLLLSSP